MRYDEDRGRAPSTGWKPGAGARPAHAHGPGLLKEPVGLANGLAWTADGATLYFVDSLARSVVSHPYSPPRAPWGPSVRWWPSTPPTGSPTGCASTTTGACGWPSTVAVPSTASDPTGDSTRW